MRKTVKYTVGALASIALIVTVLLTSVELAVWGSMAFYEKEYTKYEVTDDVSMELDDLMDVTKGMLGYLRGDREELQVETVIDGERADFFNEKEISHMEDVQRLFVHGFRLRAVAALIAAAGMLYLAFGRIEFWRVMPRCFNAVSISFAAIAAALGLLISSDFEKYFIMFHRIFFTNDLWQLDPSTDRLINIVPEGFFSDMALRIGLIFGIAMAALLAFSVTASILMKRRGGSGSTERV